jgi:hypothetical protein
MHSLACENYSMLARVAVAHGFSQLLLAFVNLAVFVQQHLSPASLPHSAKRQRLFFSCADAHTKPTVGKLNIRFGASQS